MIYPDLARGRLASLPPSVYADEARAWIVAEPLRWTPQYNYSQPADTLAVIGALVLSAAVYQPLGWDGENLRGPVDPVRLIASSKYSVSALKGAERLVIQHGGAPVLSLPPHQASKYWAGQVTTKKIWDSNLRPLMGLIAVADALAEAAGPDAPPPMTIGMDARIDAQALEDIGARASDLLPISVTGYDDTVVNIPVRDGFAASLRPDILMGGQRLAVELYALIGAAWVEAQGRWPTPHHPSIPSIDGIVLRDRLDLDRLMLIGEPLSCSGNLAGKRSYLTMSA